MKKIFTLVAMAAMAIGVNAQEIWDACNLKQVGEANPKWGDVKAGVITSTENHAQNVVFRSNENVLPYPGPDAATDPYTVEADGKATEKLYDYTILANKDHIALKAVCTPNLNETQSWGFGLSVNVTDETITNNRCLNTADCDPTFLDYIKAKSGNCTEAYIDWYEYNSDGDPTHKVYQPKWNPEATDAKPAMGSWYEFTPTVDGTLKAGIFLPKNIQNNKLYIATLAEDNFHYTLFDPTKVTVWGWYNNTTNTTEFFENTPLQSDYKIVDTSKLAVASNNPFIGYVTFDVEANKTYMMLTPDNQLGLYGFAFYFDSAGIENVKSLSKNTNAPIYNLAGQKVAKDFKGIVIQNGKKFVVK